MPKVPREKERELAPNEIPQEGCDVLLTGTSNRGKPLEKRMRVTPAGRCQDWFKYLPTEDGHQTLEISRLTDLAKGLGFTDFKVLHPELPKPEPKPAPEPSKPLATAITSAPGKPDKDAK